MRGISLPARWSGPVESAVKAAGYNEEDYDEPEGEEEENEHESDTDAEVANVTRAATRMIVIVIIPKMRHLVIASPSLSEKSPAQPRHKKCCS